ncbi:MAG: 1-deoxy-D-xylulose-5-phosphate synthase [Dehalococcoidales bacterium]|nr:1-deoxy-D-xylulose-5-phosphate synthase [Dehalococcoidales bacterium]
MSAILDRINSPEDLRPLTYPELDQLARELRREIIGTISINGGHLASSLGAVELTIAVHRVFNSPHDKIVWDVGHQAYAHKLLTGRRDRFSTIRSRDGLSPFPCREESPYDAFTTGHAGTSISAALGMALARDLDRRSFQVVAVTGDGSLGAGMAFEAVNHAGHRGSKLIVILNDNGMSISPTPGAMAKLLNQVRLDARYETAKDRFKWASKRVPFGKWFLDITMKIKTGFKRVLLPSAFWEQLGFLYIGPLDGHNIREMEAALIRARDHESKPILIHILTTKGKGHAQAEKDATLYHGIAPRIAENGNGHSSYSQVFGSTLLELMHRNKKIVAVSAAMIDGTGLAPVAAKFPRRVIDVGICEQHAVTLAAGLAAQGYIPVVAIYSTFLQRSYDQIIHDVCLPHLPVVFAVDRAGIVGEDGATHQGAFDISYLTGIPNMVVAAPADENELRDMLLTAVSSGRPVAVRYPRGMAPGVAIRPEMHTLPIGKGIVLKEGSHLAVCALGSTVYPTLEAAALLQKQGIEAAVVNARFAKPLDSELVLEYARKTKRLLTVEENILRGGFGSSILEVLALSGLTGLQTGHIALPDAFIQHGKQEDFRSRYDLDAPGIARRILSAFPTLMKGQQPTSTPLQ